MYQDDNPQLAIARDQHEKDVVLPKLRLRSTDRVLDVGCGVGRWALATAPLVMDYLGTDFSDGLLVRARDNLRDHSNVSFECLAAQDVEQLASRNAPFNRVILAGILAYLNDADAERCLRGIAKVCSRTDAIVYLREPMGVKERLTLTNFWSGQLNAEYSAIYRSRQEYELLLERTLTSQGFRVDLFANLYPEDLQNRVETSQFIVLLHRFGGG